MSYDVTTGFKATDPNTNLAQDLGSRYITKDYLLDVYPNISSSTGSRVAPGLWSWGRNNFLQLGVNLSTATSYSSPVQIGGLPTWKEISTGFGSSFAIKTDGTLWSWGGLRFGLGIWSQGELGLGTGGIYYSSPVQVGSLTNWKQVSVGAGSVGAVKTDGTLWTWGHNTSIFTAYAFFGILGVGNTTSVSSPVQVGSLTNWKQVSMTANRTAFAIKTDGTLWCLGGWNNFGVMGLGYSSSLYYSSPVQVGALTNWKQICGDRHIAAVKTDGTLWTWGYNDNGQLGINCSGDYYSSPVQVGSLTNWKQVATVGVDPACLAIKTDGTLWAWGSNVYGVLGQGNNTFYSSPIQVGTLTNWKKVTGQQAFVYALKTDGTLWTWGNNSQGQLGIDNIAYQSSPIQVGSLTNWKNIPISSLGQHVAAIQDGYI
jgi:alpha-tubulin suppressor-like RCC1 family protein